MAKTRTEPKHLLYDAARGGFLTAHGEWTEDKSKAGSFSDLATMIQFCLRHGMKDAELLIELGTGRNVRVPICS
jgi:hypothetical protein